MSEYPHHIALLGAGTIGLSMLAMHLRRPDTRVSVFDPRPDAEDQLRGQLPSFLDSSQCTSSNSNPNPSLKESPSDTLIDTLLATNRICLASSIHEAVHGATIIQEQTPELLSSKQALWTEVARSADINAHLWSSSSGIPASAQATTCPTDVQARLLVAHPFNPPHIMPLVEIVPSPTTAPERVSFAKEYFKAIPGPGAGQPNSVISQSPSISASASSQHYRPVILQKEIPGFVGNRLAFALLREACHLVGEGVVSARDLDAIVTSSLGPRWAGSGVFESYHAGGGEGGIGAFMEKLAPTVKEVWGQLGQPVIRTEEERERLRRTDGGAVGDEEKWREMVIEQTEEAYGVGLSVETRAKKVKMLSKVLEMQKECFGEL
ncbi:L-carnitine dehydrogenase [Penicillium rolfsii]|nr:L-carnitine dehydrogenase [Penicillium rolfsii]